MRCTVLHIGGRGLLAFSALAATAVATQPVPVQTRVFDIRYEVDEAAQPLDSVQLWYTLDRGMTWHQYGVDEDRQSPVTFHAPCEGEFGFYLVLKNSAGVSSGPPVRATEPHVWAFVDFTPPVVQLNALRQSTSLGQRIVQVRWTAIDQYLLSRPVSVSYQRPPDETWYPVTRDPVANTGRYDWRLPAGLSGPVAVRVSVRDRGGHEIVSEKATMDVVAVAPVVETVPASFRDESVNAALQERRDQRADRVFQEALAFQQRGELRTAISRMREVIKLDPNRPDAFATMADMLYGLGDYGTALKAYNMALEQAPSMRAALHGSALVYKHERDYGSAATQLRTILRYNPNDAEIWRDLGDVAIYQGDELLARECWTRASTVQPEATEIVQDARHRMELLDASSRQYRTDGG